MTFDFDFIVRDVNRQKEIAQNALDAAKKMDALLKQDSSLSVENRDKLVETKFVLLQIVRDLASNINYVADSAIGIFKQ